MKKFRKILFINDEVEMYGSENSLFYMASYLKSFIPIVLLPCKGPLQELLENMGVNVLIYDLHIRDLSLEAKFKRLLLIKRIINDHKIDIMHLNKPFPFIIETRIATWIKGIPLVIHVRGKYWPPIVEKCFLSYVEKIICVSEYSKKYLTQKRRSDLLAKIEMKNIEVIYNIKKLSNYFFNNDKRDRTRKTLNIKEDEIAIALIGYFSPNKGQDRFINLARILIRQFTKIKFLMIGEALDTRQENYKKEVFALINKYGLNDFFIITGYANVSEILSGIDFLVNLSESEGLCHAVIEAMAAERVVVANAVGGTPEIIGYNGSGFLVEQNNIDSMKNIIMRLINDKNIMASIGKKAKVRVERMLNAEVTINKIENLYNSILKN